MNLPRRARRSSGRVSLSQSLRQTRPDKALRTDLDALVTGWPADYEIDVVAELVIGEVLRLL